MLSTHFRALSFVSLLAFATACSQSADTHEEAGGEDEFTSGGGTAKKAGWSTAKSFAGTFSATIDGEKTVMSFRVKSIDWEKKTAKWDSLVRSTNEWVSDDTDADATIEPVLVGGKTEPGSFEIKVGRGRLFAAKLDKGAPLVGATYGGDDAVSDLKISSITAAATVDMPDPFAMLTKGACGFFVGGKLDQCRDVSSRAECNEDAFAMPRCLCEVDVRLIDGKCPAR